jgi:hypothetical protein
MATGAAGQAAEAGSVLHWSSFNLARVGVVGVSIHGLEGVPATWTDALATHSVTYRKLSKVEKKADKQDMDTWHHGDCRDPALRCAAKYPLDQGLARIAVGC